MACDAKTLIATAMANGYEKLSERELLEVIVAGACAGGGGGNVQDMQVAWTPTNLKLGELTGITSFNGGGQGIQTVTVSAATSVDGYDIELWADLTSASFPNLVSITGSGAPFQFIVGMPLLTSISAPLLQDVGSQVDLEQLAGLTSFSLPSLVTAGAFIIDQCPLLTSVSVPSYLPTNGRNQKITTCALNAASVNAFLARCVANEGFVTGVVDLSGGTNAAPSGQGIADKAALILRGVTVSTN